MGCKCSERHGPSPSHYFVGELVAAWLHEGHRKRHLYIGRVVRRSKRHLKIFLLWPGTEVELDRHTVKHHVCRV